MSAKGIINIDDYRDGGGPVVPCPRCQEPIPSASTRCPGCGVFFRGRAEDSAPGSVAYPATNRVKRICILILIAAVVAILLACLPVAIRSCAG